jgi:hypothetical protein
MRILAIVTASIPLAGCFGVTLPPKELPAWAMSRQVEPTYTRQQKTSGRAHAKRAPGHAVAVSSAGAPYAAPIAAEPLPFSSAWQAREEAFDRELRRSMNICRWC